MNKESFLKHFIFHPPILHYMTPPWFENVKNIKKAAVLIALVERPNGLHIILTKRAIHLRHHPGEISFPGGQLEQTDSNLQQTALRETEEEIGLAFEQISLFGSLQPLTTSSGFIVSPYLAFVDSQHTLKINKQEVQSTFELPLEFILKRNSFYKQHLLVNKKRHFTYLLPYQNKLIWGATAQILLTLRKHLTYSCSSFLQPQLDMPKGR